MPALVFWVGLASAHAPPAAWLPAGTVSVVGSGAASHPLVLGLGFLNEPCIGEITGALDEGYLVQVAPGAPMTSVAFGRVHRREVEACGRRLASQFGEARGKGPVFVRRAGRTTTFGTEGGQKVQVAAFWRGGFVVGGSMMEVDSVIRGPRLRRTDPIWPLLPRLEGDGARTVTVLDYTLAFTGVSSRGMVTVATGERPHGTAISRLLFANPEDAARFVAAVRAIADDPDAEPAASEIAALVAPVADGDEVEVNLTRILETLLDRKDLSDWVLQAGERMMRQGAAP